MIKCNEIGCCRKVVKKHKMHFAEHNTTSIGDIVNILHHSCIVDIDASFVVSGYVYAVTAYCEVMFLKLLCCL